MTSFPPFRVDFSDLILAHARIGDLDVTYLECPAREGRRYHWYMAAGDRGVAFVRPIADGPLVPGKPRANAEEIEAHLAEVFAGPCEDTDAQVVLAFGQGIRARGNPSPLMKSLQDLGVAVVTYHDDQARAAIKDALAPIRARLRRQIEVLDTYEVSRTRQWTPYRSRFFSSTEATSRILKMTDAELDSLSGFGTFNPLLREMLELDGVDLAAPRNEILHDVLTLLEVPAAAIRRLPKDEVPSSAVVQVMRTLPVDWLPRHDDKEGWTALKLTAMALQSCWLSEVAWPALAAGCKGDWVAFAERCARAAFGPDGDRRPLGFVHTAVRYARDVTVGFSTFLGLLTGDALAARIAAADIADEATVGDRGLPAILENSRLWHARFRPLPPSNVRWRALLPRWTDASTGIEVVPLTNSGMLIDEGDVMGHCVGGEAFALASLRNEARVVSLRRGKERLSTAEIALHEDPSGKPLPGGVVQHYGKGNAQPCESAVAALAAYVELDEVHDARRRAKVNVKRLPERTPEELAEMLERWRPFLTGRWKRASLEEFRKAMSPPEPRISPEHGRPQAGP